MIKQHITFKKTYKKWFYFKSDSVGRKLTSFDLLWDINICNMLLFSVLNKTTCGPCELGKFDQFWIQLRMRFSLVVRASDCQCTSCNGPGFDPSIRRHSEIWGAADEAVLNIVLNKREKIPQKYKKKKKNSGKKYCRSLSSCPESIALVYPLWREERCNRCFAELGKIKLKINFFKV